MADDECDYLVIGGGATGMAFSDSLLNNTSEPNLRVIVVDKHEAPGGQWHDSYDFVQLHQPSKGYGVETKMIGTGDASKDHHRATRSELLQYYSDVRSDLESKHDFVFLGGTTLDLAQLYDGNASREDYTVTNDSTGVSRTIRVRKRLVDARNLEPDLPVSTPPKFAFSPESVSVLPVNDLVGNTSGESEESAEKKHFVVVGGGKTGMDAVTHLLNEKHVLPENLLWVVPNHAWITARENIGNCIDLLYTAAELHDDAITGSDDDDEKKEADATGATAAGIGPDFFQRGFIEWEKQGHIYRLDPSVVPTKFKDATLSLEELNLLQTTVPSMVRAGRIAKITDEGSMVFQDGSTMELPFPVADTLFLHCAAGAFHCSKSDRSPPPIFENRRIVVQDIYGTPGFCFVGSMLGKMESLAGLTDDERNAMARRPEPSSEPTPPLGQSGGDVIGKVSEDHQFVQRAKNLRMWMDTPELRDWLFANHLFHMAGADPEIVSDKLDFVFKVLRKNGILLDQQPRLNEENESASQ
jgi:hypothetical protein